MKARLVGALALVVLLGALALARLARERPAPNEAVARIAFIEGVEIGTPVIGTGVLGRIGQVTRVQRSGGDLILRLRFDSDSGVVRRHGDAISIRGLRRGRVLTFVGAPTYETPGALSDTLRGARRGDRPADVPALLGGLYRPAQRTTPDSSPRR
jgi:hypothetical protein